MDYALSTADLRDLREFQRKNALHKINDRAAWGEMGGGWRVLVSYWTPVLAIHPATSRVVRLWDGWSATTARHVRQFLEAYGLRGICKADWWDMPIGFTAEQLEEINAA